MTPDYMEKLGLSKAPFSVLLDDDSYYENENKTNIQKKIAHLLEYTNLVLFIQGEKGIGKTSLIKHGLSKHKEDWLICCLNSNDYTRAEAFIEKLATDFDLDLANTPSPILSLQEQLGALQHTGKLPILVIDDIEEIKEALIPLVSTLIQPSHFTGKNNQNDINDPHLRNERPSLRLVISGEKIPLALLKAIPQKDEEEQLKYLPVLPLTEPETAQYVKHRLQVAGYYKSAPFDAAETKNIYLQSKGLPQAINQIANQKLSTFANNKPEKKVSAMLNTHNKKLKIAAASLATLVVITVVIMNLSSHSETTFTEQTKALAIPTIAIPHAATQNNASNIATKPTIAESTAPAPKASDNPNTETTAPQPEKSTTREKTAQANKIATETIREPTSTQAQAAPPPERSKNTVQKQPLLRTSKNAAIWINSQNPDFFTLQLIGSTKKSSAEQFIKQHNLQNDAYVFSTTRKGKPWYSVIYKSFARRKEAVSAANSLPKSLNKIKPWIRQFEHIKQDMK